MAYINDVVAHFEAEYGGERGFTDIQIDGDRDDRIYARYDGERAVILIRPVGEDNAAAYRQWVTYRPKDFDAFTAGRPAGYHYFALMVGMLPLDAIWWSALYDERLLPQDLAERRTTTNGGWFYRWDPRAADVARLHWVDLVEREQDRRDAVAQETAALELASAAMDAPAIGVAGLDRSTGFDPHRRRVRIDEGLELLVDSEVMKHLDREYLQSVLRNLHRATGSVLTYLNARERQRLSGATSASRRRAG